MQTVGARIKKARENKGFTQKEVADRAGMKVSLYQMYEYEKRNPKDTQLIKIADAIGVDVHELEPPKITSDIDLLYALREIDQSFGKVFVEEGGRSVRIVLDKRCIVPNDESICEEKLDIYDSHIKRIGPDELLKFAESRYSKQQWITMLRTALREFQLIGYCGIDETLECLEHRDLKMARYNLERLKRNLNVLIEDALKDQ